MVTVNDMARLSIEAPRYTSYPTAAEFSPVTTAVDFRAALEEVCRTGELFISTGESKTRTVSGPDSCHIEQSGTARWWGEMNSGLSASPEAVLGTCLRLELEAAALYKRFQGAATEPALIELWETMSRAEIQHARLIEQLAGRRQLTVPAVSRAVLRALVERVDAIRTQADVGGLTADGMLSITAALEFSEMDDLFTAICQAAGVSPDEGRVDHLGPLVQAVSAREDSDRVLRHLLAAMLRLRRRAGSAAPSLLDASRSDPVVRGA